MSVVTSVVQASHVSKSFGPLLVLDDVSFAVERGEVVVTIPYRDILAETAS